MKKLDIQKNPSGGFSLRVSLNLGPKRKRLRKKFRLLKTHDIMKAQEYAIVVLQTLQTLGVYERDIPTCAEKQGPEVCADLPLFKVENAMQ